MKTFYILHWKLSKCLITKSETYMFESVIAVNMGFNWTHAVIWREHEGTEGKPAIEQLTVLFSISTEAHSWMLEAPPRILIYEWVTIFCVSLLGLCCIIAAGINYKLFWKATYVVIYI